VCDGLYACVCVCVYVCFAYVSGCVCGYVCECMWLFKWVCQAVLGCLCFYVFESVCVYVCMFIHMVAEMFLWCCFFFLSFPLPQ
jgi:hypothetical protein